MLDSIKLFLATNQLLVLSILTLMVAIAVLSKESMRFWIKDFWIQFPFLGAIDRLSKDATVDSRGSGWTNSERDLCAKYQIYVNPITKHDFNRNIKYLTKAGDLGKRPASLWIMFVLALLVIAEGLGFSYLLGTWLARDGSANTHTVLMFAFSIVMASILLYITHHAGNQFRRTSKLRSCFAQYKESGGSSYSGRKVALIDDQSIDDHLPEYQQMQSRVGNDSRDKGSYWWGIAAIILISVIAVASTAMRWENLQAELTRETVGSTATGNPFNEISLPTEVIASQQSADDKAKAEISKNTEMEGLMSFAILGIIFIFTQVVGMSVGYKQGFDGIESHNAFKETKGVSTYEAYWRLYEPLVDLANSRLKELQQKMEKGSHTKLTLTKTFPDYLKENRSELDKISNAYSEKISDIDRIKAEISQINNTEEQKEYYIRLSTDMQEQLKPWLAERKKIAQMAENKQKELDELF